MKTYFNCIAYYSWSLHLSQNIHIYLGYLFIIYAHLRFMLLLYRTVKFSRGWYYQCNTIDSAFYVLFWISQNKNEYFKFISSLNCLDVILNLILKQHHSEHKYIPPSVVIWHSRDLVCCKAEVLLLDRLELTSRLLKLLFIEKWNTFLTVCTEGDDDKRWLPKNCEKPSNSELLIFRHPAHASASPGTCPRESSVPWHEYCFFFARARSVI